MITKLQTLILTLMLGTGGVCYADEGDLVGIRPIGADARVVNQSPAELMASLHFQKGKITLPSGIATLDLPPQYEYLPPEEANKILVSAWGNPKRADTQGLIVAADHSVLGPDGWAVVVRYIADGHVRETEADNLQYEDILRGLQRQADEDSAHRFKNGYNSLSLLGWADVPSYNPKTHQYDLAKELAVLGNTETTLNYDVRILGRQGVLDLNGVAPMHDYNLVKRHIDLLTGVTQFAAGQAYSDFNPLTDHIAGYTATDMVKGYVSQMSWINNFWPTLLALKYAVITAALALLLVFGTFLYSMRRIRRGRVYVR